jgi:hypothetical protein
MIADPIAIAVWTIAVIGAYHSLEYLFPKVTERFKALKPGRRRYVIVSVGLLATIGLFLDYNVETHWDALLVYAYLSMWTGVVNLYLGSRFLLKRRDDTEDWIRRNLAVVALWVYMFCCSANWLYQLHTIMLWLDFRWAQLSWSNFAGLVAYCSMLVFIVKDDLILMRALVKECSPYRTPASLSEQAKHFEEVLQTEMVDDNEEWPLGVRKTMGGMGGTIDITTNYPWGINLTAILEKVRRFRTPYSVSLQSSRVRRLVFSVTAVHT